MSSLPQLHKNAPIQEFSKPIKGGEVIGAAVVLAACLLIMYWQTIWSRFAVTEGGGDSVLYNVILEHQWRWISGDASHRSLWSPPVFFPQTKIAGYTDLMLGVFPAYAAFRLIGADPQTAFQLWMVTMSALNYLAAYLLLRALVLASAGASAIGAAFFAMGSPRLAQTGHPQLLPGFFVVAVFGGLYLLLSDPPATLPRRRLSIGLLLAGGGAIAQIYTAFYNAWFMAFSAAVALLCALLVPRFRQRLFEFLQRYWLPCVISAVVAALFLAPVVRVYYGVLRDVGERQYSEVQRFLPPVTAWLAQGPDHWIYGSLNRWRGIGPDFGGQEMFNGIGLLTTALVLAGFLRFRSRPVVAIWGAIGAISLVASLAWPGGFSFWGWAYAYFPAAKAIRAVSRFSVFLLLPAAIAVALSIDWLAKRVSPLLAAFCMIAVVAEQAGSSGLVPVYSRVTVEGPAEAIVHRLGPECKTFLASFPRNSTSVPWMHIFAMWAELQSGVPTLNGYSGQVPPAWPLGDVSVAGPPDRVRLVAAIREWMGRHPREIENVCWITPDAPTAELIKSTETGGGAN